MYLARFSYDVLPVHRQRAIDLIRSEVEAARRDGFKARMLMPLRGGRDGTALQLEIQLTTLDQLDKFRHRGVRSSEAASRMKAFGALLPPPAVEILRADEMKAS